MTNVHKNLKPNVFLLICIQVNMLSMLCGVDSVSSVAWKVIKLNQDNILHTINLVVNV